MNDKIEDSSSSYSSSEGELERGFPTRRGLKAGVPEDKPISKLSTPTNARQILLSQVNEKTKTSN